MTISLSDASRKHCEKGESAGYKMTISLCDVSSTHCDKRENAG